MTSPLHSRHFGKATTFWLCDFCGAGIEQGERMVAIRTNDPSSPWLRSHIRCARRHDSFQQFTPASSAQIAITSFGSTRPSTGFCRWCNQRLNENTVMVTMTKNRQPTGGWLAFHRECAPDTVNRFEVARWLGLADNAPEMLTIEGTRQIVTTLEEDQVATGMRPLDDLTPDTITTAHVYGHTNHSASMRRRFDQMKNG
jgi:hypothetical protein